MANQARHSYVQFYPSDWLGGMAYMPPMAEWLYLQICLYNWDKREPMPAAQSKLRLSRSPEWETDLEALLEAGKVIKTQGGGLFVERAMVEAERAFELWDKKSRGGRKSKTKEKQKEEKHSSKSDGNTLGKSGGGSLASNENENENENIPNGISPQSPPNGDLVFSVDDEALREFRKHRIKLKAPLTPHAEKLLLRKLEKYHREGGHDPTAVLEQSIENGWKGVFELKGANNGNGNSNATGNGLLDACLADKGSSDNGGEE